MGLIFETADPGDRRADARVAIAGYRILLDWSEELNFTAKFAELAGVVSRSADADQCVQGLLAAGEESVAGMLLQGRRPPAPSPRPRRPAGALPRLGAGSPRTNSTQQAPLDPPTIGQILRLAHWTASQYRVFLQISDGSYYGTCPEVPSASGFGPTASSCVAEIRAYAAAAVAEILATKQMPPEPMQDLERRRHARQAA